MEHLSLSDKASPVLSSLPPSFPIHWRDSSIHYEQARVGRVFNHRRPERYPLAVVEATCEDHLVETVRLAKSLNCRISVRSGGHSWAAWSVRDNAILIDLGRYFAFAYDAKTGIVTASPSTTGRQLNAYLEPLGRMFPGGHCPDVGIGGFLLQGGMGWNCKNWGWACENVVGIDVVTADGERVHCDTTENSDLFYAARGAGPGFPGLVSRFYLATREQPRCVRSAAYFYKKEDYRKALTWITGITSDYDSDTEIVAVSSYPPGSEELNIMVLLTTFKHTEAEARKALQRAEDTHPSGKLFGWFLKPTSVQSEYADQHRANPEGHRWCVDNAYVRDDADVVATLEEAFTTLPTKKSFSLWYSMAPCSRRSLPEMSLSMQTDHYFATYVVSEHSKEDERCRKWVDGIMKRMEPQTAGAYLGDSDFQQRQTRYWGPEQGKKLMAIRKRWDPEGRICGYLDLGDKSGVNGLANL